MIVLQESGHPMKRVRLSRDGGTLYAWSVRDRQRLWHTEDPLTDVPSYATVAPDGRLLATVMPPADASLTFAALFDDSPEDDSGPRPADVSVWTAVTGRV